MTLRQAESLIDGTFASQQIMSITKALHIGSIATIFPRPLIRRPLRRKATKPGRRKHGAGRSSVSSKPWSISEPWSACNLERRLMLAGDLGAAVASSTIASPPPANPAEISMPTIAPATTAVEVVFIDSEVEELETLSKLVQRSAEVVLVDASSDPLEQISRVIQSHAEIQAVHILSHGKSGAIDLGGRLIGREELMDASELLKQWRGSLTNNADILVYGCDVASGEAGQAWLKTLARLTGADVAGSTDRTGASQLDGDWDLESTTGDIQTDLIASAQSLATVSVALPITIRAAGSQGDEQMQLQIDGTTVQAWNRVGGDASNRQF